MPAAVKRGRVKQWSRMGASFLFVCLLLFSLPVAADECLSGDCQDGTGSGFTDEGKLYSGEWKDGVPHGRGQLTLTDGSVLRGVFVEGELVKKEEEHERKGND